MVISFDSRSVTLFALFSVLWSQGSGDPAPGSDPSSSTPEYTDDREMLDQMSAREFLESWIGDSIRARRHTDGLFTSEYSKMLGQLSAREYLESLMGSSESRQPRASDADEAGNNPSNRARRHTDGLFTSEYSKMLGQLSAREYLESLMGSSESRQPRASDADEAGNNPSNRARRHTDGLFTSEYSKMLCQLSARAYLESLMGSSESRQPRASDADEAGNNPSNSDDEPGNPADTEPLDEN